MNDELGRKIMTKIVGLRAKACSYLKMTVVKIKKQKAKKVCHIKKIKLNLTFQKQLNLRIKYTIQKKNEQVVLKKS